MFSSGLENVADVFGGVPSTSEALEAVCANNVASYAAMLSHLSVTCDNQTIDLLLQTIQRLVPTKSFATVFGNRTVMPVLLLFAPPVLFRAATLLESAGSEMLDPNSEWHALSSFLLSVHTGLLASPEQLAVRVNTLPLLPNLPTTKVIPSLASIFSPSVMADVVPLPPFVAGSESTLRASNFGMVLYTVICGISHLMQVIMGASHSVVQGGGTLEFLQNLMRLVLVPTVVMYGSKEMNLQTAIGSLLVSIRGLLTLRETTNEVPKSLLAQWPMATQCWFDLATHSGNSACMQLLLPYLLSFDTAWNL